MNIKYHRNNQTNPDYHPDPYWLQMSIKEKRAFIAKRKIENQEKLNKLIEDKDKQRAKYVLWGILGAIVLALVIWLIVSCFPSVKDGIEEGKNFWSQWGI